MPEEWTESKLPGLVVPMPTLPSLLTKNNDVEALLIMLKAAVVESFVNPAIVVLAKRPVEVPTPRLAAESSFKI